MKKKITIALLLLISIFANCYAKEVYKFLTSCGKSFYLDMDSLKTPEDFEAMYILCDQTLCPENWDIDSF